MQFKFSFLLTFALILSLALSQLASAATLEAAGGIESGRYIDGVNLTDNRPSVFLATELSANNGAFAGFSCFLSEQSDRTILQRGCDLQLGWFLPINEKHAFTVAVARHDYSSPVLRGWEYTDANLRWHIGKNSSLGLRVSDSLLGQNIASATAFSEFLFGVSDRIGLQLEFGYTQLESNERTDSLSYLLTGIEFGADQWTVQAKAMVRDKNFAEFSRLDNGQSDLSLSVQYRFY